MFSLGTLYLWYILYFSQLSSHFGFTGFMILNCVMFKASVFSELMKRLLVLNDNFI
jgi:hypothetical protein